MTKIITFHLLIIAILSADYSFAQIKSNYKCIYSFDMMKDTVACSYFRNESYVLQIGDGFTKGFTYNNFYVDSLRTHDNKKYRQLISEILDQALQTRDRSIIGNNHVSEGNFQSYVYKNYNKTEISVIEQVVNNDFVYSDELKPQEWEIYNDTMSVLGYLSQKASCNFRGREFIAWFTPEIPISEGPWKFYGLPGLITKLYDVENHYKFSLISFQGNSELIDMTIPKGAAKVKRVSFLKESANGDLENRINQSMSQTMGFGSVAKKIRMYDNIELDYK